MYNEFGYLISEIFMDLNDNSKATIKYILDEMGNWIYFLHDNGTRYYREIKYYE